MNIQDVADAIKSGSHYPFNTNKQPLEDTQRISDVWPQHPSDGQLHVYVCVATSTHHPGSPQQHVCKTEMSDATHELWYLVQGDNAPFLVLPSPTTSIRGLKRMLKDDSPCLQSVSASSLILWKVRRFLVIVLTLWVTPLYP